MGERWVGRVAFSVRERAAERNVAWKREKNAVVTSSARSSPRQMMKWSSINRLLNTAADPKVGGFIWFNGLDFWGVRLKELRLGLVI